MGSLIGTTQERKKLDHVFLVKIQDACAAYERFKRNAHVDRIEDVEGKAENVSSKSVLMVSTELEFAHPETRIVKTAFAVHPEKVKSACCQLLTKSSSHLLT